MNSIPIVRAFGILCIAAMMMACAASAAEVRVMISAGFHGVYSGLVPAFERSIGHRLVTRLGIADQLAGKTGKVRGPHSVGPVAAAAIVTAGLMPVSAREVK